MPSRFAPAVACALAALLVHAASARPTTPALTRWNEPGPANLFQPAGPAPWPPSDKAAREVWAEIAMLEDTRASDVSRLIGHLQSSADWLVRWRVCRAFGRLQDSTAIEPLLDALEKDPAPSVRAEAAFALGQVGSRKATQALIYAVREQADRRVRARALEALGKIGDHAATGVVTAQLTSGDAELSREAAIACWKLQDSTTAPFLAQGAKSEDALTRAFCAYAMERAAMPEITIKPLTMLVSDPNLTVRAYAARALGRQRSPLALEPLLRAASDKDFRVRVSAQRALGTRADSTALPQVLGGLLDPEPSVRETAAAAAQALRSRDAAVALRKALADPDPAVRLASARALAGLLGDDAWGDLKGMLVDSERWVRAGVLETLAGLHGEEPRLMLQKVAAGVRAIGGPASIEERAAAFSGLSAAKATTARGEIHSGIRDGSWLVAAAATDAAGASGDSTLTDDIVWVARHNPDPRETDVLLSAYGALEALGRGAVSARVAAAMPGAADSVHAVLATGLSSADPRQRDAAGKAFAAVFGADAATKARAEYPPPAWHEAPLADYRALLADEDSTGALGRVTGATIETKGGKIELALDPREAPLTVRNFVTLAEKHYYDDVHWHRIVPYFVIQDGDPTGTGSGGPGYTFRCEYNELRYDTGALGMALSGKDTGGSQYFFTLSPQPHLDGRYTIFGHVVKGQDVVERTRRGDRITHITVHRR
jgi:cyclophilin family peptidyl-prolyl cis-trans isomerase/HEAT repeat protein